MFAFCYGTLKQGHVNNPLLADQEFLGPAYTAENRFRLYEERKYRYPFPCLVEAEDGHKVYGELYTIGESGLRVLDRLEGVDQGLYKRAQIKAVNVHGEEVDAITYVYLQSTEGLVSCGKCWPPSELPRWEMTGKRIRQAEGITTTGTKMLWDTTKNIALSPLYNTNVELAEWAAENSTTFCGEKVSTQVWQSLFAPFI